MVAIKDIEMPKSCWDCPILCKENGQCEMTKKYIYGNDIPSDCPLEEIEERKVGKWIEHKQKVAIGYREFIACPFCKCWFGKWELPRNSYCPNCGAEMRGC